MVDIARALQGLGAAVGGQVPQFEQRIALEDERARRIAQEEADRTRRLSLEDEELAEKRKKTMFLDAAAASQYLSSGDLDSVEGIFSDRINILSNYPNVNTNHTQRKLELARAAKGGDTEALNRLRSLLANEVSVGQAYGFIPKAEAKPNVKIGKGEVLLGPDNEVLFSNVQPEKPPARQTYQDRMGVTRYRDTGRTVYEESEAGMSSAQPTAQAQPAQTGATQTLPQDDYLAGLSPVDRRIAEAEQIERENKQAEFDREQRAAQEQEQMIINEAKTAYMIAKELRDNVAGLKGAVGPISSMLPSFKEDTVEFQSKLDYLQSLLTLGNLGRMTGVLSESDLALLSKAASGLDVGVGEAAFKQQLNTIIDDLEKGLLAKEVDLSTASRPSTRTGDWRSTTVFDEVLRNEGLLKGV